MKIIRQKWSELLIADLQLALVTLLAFLSFPNPTFASDQTAANQLFVTGVSEWNEASVISDNFDDNLEIRAKLIESVWIKLNRIVKDYGGSDIAVKLAIGERIGPLSLSQVESALKNVRYQQELVSCSEVGIEIPRPACLFSEALDAVSSIALDDYYTEPSTFTNLGFSRVAQSQAELGYHSQALTTARMIKDYEFRVGSLGPMADIVRYQAKAGLFEEAFQAAQMIGDSSEKSKALRHVAIAQSEIGRFNEAFAIATSIESSYHKSLLLLALGRIQEALELSRSIEGSSDRARALIELSKELGDARLIFEALEAARSINDRFGRSVVLRRVAEAQAEAGWFDEALKTVSEIEMQNFRSMALSDVGQALAAKGLLSEALYLAEYIEFGSSPDHVRLFVVERQFEGGAIQDALKTAFALEENWSIAIAFALLAEELENPALMERALEAARSSNDATERANALLQIGAAQARPDLIWNAIIADSTVDSDAALDIALTTADAGVLEQAYEVSREIEDDFERTETQMRIAQALNNSGMIREIIEESRGIERGFARAVTLSRVAVALGQ